MTLPPLHPDRGIRLPALDHLVGEVLDTVLSLVDTAVLVTDRDGRVALWNAGAEQMFGWSAQEATGELARELIVPFNRFGAAAEIRRALFAGDHWTGEFTCRRRDGDLAPVDVIAVPLMDAGGDVVSIVSMCTDISLRLINERGDAALQAVTNAASDAILTVTDQRIATWSPAAERLLGWSAAEAIGLDFHVVAPEDRWGEADELLRLIESGGTINGVLTERLTKGGTRVRVELNVTSVLDKATDKWFGVVTMRDLRSRDEVLAAAHAAEVRFRSLLARSSELVVIVDIDGIVRSTSPSRDALAPTVSNPTSGLHIGDIVHPDDRDLIVQAHARAVSGEESHPVVVYRRTTASGEVRWREATLTNVLDDPIIAGIVFNIRDVTEREQANAAIERLANFDELTGLPNRHRLLEIIRDSIHANGTDRGALVFFDLDDFCDVNDTLGHRLGDELLVSISQRVSQSLPEHASLARFGGDQFAVFCNPVDSLAHCLAIADRVRRTFYAPFLLDGSEVFVTVSQGVALGVDCGEDADTLISNADSALYRAKGAGTALTVVFEPAHGVQTARRLHFAGEIRKALEQDEIVAFFQPVVDLQSGQVVAVEALARWHHKAHGPIPPDEFILVAESTGLIADLGASILRQSCGAAAKWARHGRRLQVAVNASALQLMDPTFPALVHDTLMEYGLPADQLSIEITETAALRDFDAALATLEALQQQGILLSLDDFGTGYSSLSFLKRLPVSALKIDRSFVMGLGGDEADDRIVTGVVHLGLALGFHLVAEGVETTAQAEQLRRLGCQYGQGFLWSPAVPADDLFATIDRIESQFTPA